MKRFVINVVEKYGTFLVVVCFAVALLGLAGSLLVPNVSTQTVSFNMDNQGEFLIDLNNGSVVDFYFNSGGRPLGGIQPGISKMGKNIMEGSIVYDVYQAEGRVLLGTGSVNMADVLDEQYVYLPFSGMKECNGDLIVSFHGENLVSGNEPGLIANAAVLDQVKTVVNGDSVPGNLKSEFVYLVKSFPLVWDFAMLSAIFFTVCCTLRFNWRGRKPGKGSSQVYEEV